jgi:phosphatidate cytidylyltransferase
LVQIGVLGALAMPFAALGARRFGDARLLVLLGAAWMVVVMLLALRTRTPQDRPLAAVAITAFGALYTGGLPSFLLWLRESPAASSAWAATWLVFLPLALTWICDSLAMAGGNWVGGAKLAPVISPHKTWSGFVTGAIGATLLGPLYGYLVLDRVGVHVPVLALLLVGLGIGTLGQLGDLAESLFKREAQVKDSGSFFPGHGGVLDRLDSLYWGIPTTALILRAFGWA